MKSKRNRILVGIVAICMLTIVIAVSYAYIAYYARQSEVNVLRTDCMKIEFKEKTNAISLTKAIPISDEEGTNTKPYIFEITNTCGVGMHYNVNLEVLTVKEGIELSNLIESKNIATKIDNLEVKRLTSEIATTPTYDESDYKATESYTMYTGVLNPGETKSHEVRVWLHSSAGNETQNKSFYSKVVIEGIQNEVASLNFSDYIINERQKDTSIVQVVHEATVQTGLNATIDYRYTGKNPNNYVCFGSEVSPCPSDNLYRIIGVIPTQSSENGEYENRVKLIKNDYYTETTSGYLENSETTSNKKGYRWNNSEINKWEGSTLQNQVLNGVYWSSLGIYQNYIEQATWYLGASTYQGYRTYSPELFYKCERSNTKGKSGGLTNYIAYIGLMYPSDYGYSIEKNYWNQSILSNANMYTRSSWLYNLENKYYEWTIAPESNYSLVTAWAINPGGEVNASLVYSISFVWGIRPTFYLKSSVQYTIGDGSIDNPYRIGL